MGPRVNPLLIPFFIPCIVPDNGKLLCKEWVLECSSAFLSVWIEFGAYSGRGGGIARVKGYGDLGMAIVRVGSLSCFSSRVRVDRYFDISILKGMKRWRRINDWFCLWKYGIQAEG
jgi:hypothetical protein